MSRPLPQQDLGHVVSGVGNLWEILAGKRVLFTGASGFFGSWMLEAFLHAGSTLNLPFRALAVTRNSARFIQNLPHIATDPRVEILEADVTNLSEPEGPVDFLIHSLYAPAALPDLEVQYRRGASGLLDIAANKGSLGCLLCSTGAVYVPRESQQPIPESWQRYGKNHPLSYSRIRAQVEDQWEQGFLQRGLPVKIARGFAFVGPRLLLDGQFAVGNFLRDILAGHEILVKGDGTSVRSYLHAADLAVHLWCIVLKGEPGAIFNVGGSHPITVGEVAHEVARLLNPPASVRLLSENSSFSYYVPDTSRLHAAMTLPEAIPFPEALSRTWEWLRPLPTP